MLDDRQKIAYLTQIRNMLKDHAGDLTDEELRRIGDYAAEMASGCRVPDRVVILSEDEQRIYDLMQAGATAERIAEVMGCSVRKAYYLKSAIKDKLQGGGA